MKPSIRFFVLVFLAIIVLISSIQMVRLPLWGYLPLVLFAASWAFWRILMLHKFSKSPNSTKLLALSTLSGFLLSLSFLMPYPFFLTLFVGFIPLLWVEKNLSQDGKISIWENFKFAFHTFVVWNILTTYWVANSAFVPGIIAIFANSFLMTIPFLLFHLAKNKLKNTWIGLFSLVTFWLSFEFIHLRWEISWPWLTLGNGLAGCTQLVQWYEYTGVPGGSLWILLINILIYRFSVTYVRFEPLKIVGKYRNSVVTLSLLVFLPMLFSVFLYQKFDLTQSDKTAEVVVVQPNFEPHYEKFTVTENEQLDKFFRLSTQQVSQKTDYLLFPETSFDQINVRTLGKLGITVPLQNYAQNNNKLHIVTGLDAYKILTDDEISTSATRTSKNGRLRWEAFNGAAQFVSDSSQIVPFYKKSKLVPGAELLPFGKLLSFLKPFFRSFGGTIEGCGTQENRSVFWNKEKEIAVAPIICYESIYGEYVGEYVKNGANALFIMTNDGWWDDTDGYRQHLRFATLRAIETRREIARSANTGTSCFINARGDIFQNTKYGTDAAIKQNINLYFNKTFYVTYGDFISRIANILSLAFLTTVIFVFFKKLL